MNSNENKDTEPLLDFTILTDNLDSFNEHLNSSYCPDHSFSFEQGFEVNTNIYSLKNADNRRFEHLKIPKFIK